MKYFGYEIFAIYDSSLLEGARKCMRLNPTHLEDNNSDMLHLLQIHHYLVRVIKEDIPNLQCHVQQY